MDAKVMNVKALKHCIENAIREDARLWNEEKTELNYPLLFDLLEHSDSTLYSYLLKDAVVREKFFVKVENAFVFKSNDFRFFIEEHAIDNSYTAYKNRIGLSNGTRFLKNCHDIVLDFPYKDCVLEGGQSTEEGTDKYFAYCEKYEEKRAKRKEIFFNDVLAQNEIDRLFDAKALTKGTRYRRDGAQKVEEIHRDTDGTIRENLILKGNNLIALHSLKKQFAKKVKLIYIDPPYNTGNDGFKYNDNFNHSTWLVFMKNRLEVARNLLRDDGVIFVQCDDNEQAYLKVLMDEVFGRENFVSNIVWRKRGDPPSNKKIGNTTENILMYGDVRNLYLRVRGEDTSNFSNPDNDFRGEWRHEKLFISNKGGRETQSMIYSIINPLDGKEHWPPANNRWAISKEKADIYLKEGKIVFGKTRPLRKKFKSELREGITWTNLWTSDAHSKFPMNRDGNFEITQLFNKEIFENPKPEALLERIIHIATQPGDIVLDYHLGSGTTCAVAHKMGRQYIGIEQMDYIESIAVARVRKVIEGEQGGISKAVQWQGGGSFIYAELAPWNEQAKETILACENLEALESFFDAMYERYFLNYNVKVQEFKEKVLQEEAFRALSLEEHKRIFCAMLDNNQMYVCASEMADLQYNISTEAQAMTKSFYGEVEHE